MIKSQEPELIKYTSKERCLEPESFYDEISKTLLNNSVVLLAGEIDLETATDIARELMYVSFVGWINRLPITVVLNSVGGEVYAGLLIYETINDLKRKGFIVNVEVRGLAASMGCIILQAGTRRISSGATRFLIHEVESWDWGKVSEMEDRVSETRKVNNMLRDIIAKRSLRSPEEIDKLWTKRDVWYSAQEALEFGLIDSILE